MDVLNTFSESSKYFLEKAKTETGNKAYYYSIASTVCTWMLLEAYINQVADTLSVARKLKDHEKLYLQENELRVNRDGFFQSVKSCPPTLIKSLFLLNLFSKKNPKRFKQTELWEQIKRCEEIRDSLIHPKKEDINIDFKKAKWCFDTVFKFIQYINKQIFKKKIKLG